MKTDIQIAQEAVMLPIKEVAASIGINEDDLELYGKYKAKLSDELMDRTKNNPNGKLILVTAINPTPAGEGKTTTSVGLGQAFGKLGKKAIYGLHQVLEREIHQHNDECDDYGSYHHNNGRRLQTLHRRPSNLLYKFFIGFFDVIYQSHNCFSLFK